MALCDGCIGFCTCEAKNGQAWMITTGLGAVINIMAFMSAINIYNKFKAFQTALDLDVSGGGGGGSPSEGESNNSGSVDDGAAQFLFVMFTMSATCITRSISVIWAVAGAPTCRQILHSSREYFAHRNVVTSVVYTEWYFSDSVLRRRLVCACSFSAW